MLFNSVEFLFFLLAALPVYWLIPDRVRWIWLLLCSCGFYMVLIPSYLLVLAALIVLDYLAALGMGRYPKLKKPLLTTSLFGNLGILFLFKYSEFFVQNLNSLSAVFGLNIHANVPHWVLPLGLSFHTFQSMSYVIEVYRGKYQPEKHFGKYALFVMFFPQLVAGPIERPAQLLPQINQPKRWLLTGKVRLALQLMIWGYLKKLVIADNLGVGVDWIYGHCNEVSYVALALATVGFSLQIYCDFSGYTDIAVGVAQLMGFELSRNFNLPYLSSSIGEFWRRWHVSLSSWFRDYLYIPLGGSRGSFERTALNLLIVFAVSGLWHGAAWRFVIWGLIHGFALIAQNTYLKMGFRRPPRGVGRLLTLTTVAMAWIFFRAESVSKAALMIGRMCTFALHSRWLTDLQLIFRLFDPKSLLALILATVGLIYFEQQSGTSFEVGELERRLYDRGLLFWSSCLGLLYWGARPASQTFIYFQF